MFKKYFILLVIFLGFILPTAIMAAGDPCNYSYSHYGDTINECDANNNNSIGKFEARTTVENYNHLGSEYLSKDAFIAVMRFFLYDCVIPTQENDPVSGTLSMNKTQFIVGETIELTVTGQDKDGLGYLWAHYQGAWHKDYADGTEFISKFTFSESKPGTYVYKGYVYGKEPDGSKEGDWTEPKTVKVVVTIQEEKYPDLTITSAEISNNDGKIYYTVKNQGDALSPTSESFFTVDGERGGTSYISSMAPSASKTFHFDNWECGVQGQSHSIGICVDWNHQVSEYNENNNCHNEILVCPEEQVVDCSSYGTQYWCSTYNEWALECQGQGKIISLGNKFCYSGSNQHNYCATCQKPEGNHALIGNLSVNKTQVSVGESFNVTISAQDGDGVKMLKTAWDDQWHTNYCDGDSANCTKTYTFEKNSPGDYEYFGYVFGLLPDGKPEYDWTTPKFVKVTVEAAPAKGTDLIISSVSVKPSSPDTNDEISFDITIKNIGDEKMPYINGGIITKVSSNSLPGTGYRICDAMIKRLDAGESDTIDCPIVQTLSERTHGFTFLVDSSNRLSETKENNNEKTKIFSVASGSSNVVCTDTDGGKDYYVRGKATGLYRDEKVTGSIWGEDATNCSMREDQSLNYSIFYDCCSSPGSNQLNESYCDENGIMQSTGYQCPNGCENGVCIKEEETACTDSDNGDIYTKGYCEDYRHTNDGWDMCSDGVYQGGLLEYICTDSYLGNVCGTKHHSCPNSCENGACIQ